MWNCVYQQTCKGPVKRVTVSAPSGKVWGDYLYCGAAIGKVREYGYTVDFSEN